MTSLQLALFKFHMYPSTKSLQIRNQRFWHFLPKQTGSQTALEVSTEAKQKKTEFFTLQKKISFACLPSSINSNKLLVILKNL